MRSAEIISYRKALEKIKDWPFVLKKFSFEDFLGSGSGTIFLKSPITMIAGGNGSGKTTILNAIWALFDPAKARLSIKAQSRLTQGLAAVEFNINGVSCVFKAEFPVSDDVAPEQLEAEIVFLESAAEVARLQVFFARSGEEEDDLINGVGALDIGDKDLADIKWISGKDYQKLRLYEIEDVSGEFAFFEAVVDGREYSSRTMGDGELATLYLWWKFFRAKECSLFLLEEPETFISPRSQSKVAEFIMVQAVKKKHTVVLTSHSSKVVAALGVGRGVYLYRSGSNVVGESGNPHPSLLEEIGISPVVDIIIYVEDEAGAELLRFILEYVDVNFSRRCEIVDVGGEGQISAILKRVSGRGARVRTLGGYDGDQKGHVPNDVTSLAFFLPGSKPIELIMKAALEENPAMFGQISGIQRVAQISSGLKGLDVHDWFEEFCKQVGRTKKQVYPSFFQFLVADRDFAADCKSVISELKDRLSLV